MTDHKKALGILREAIHSEGALGIIPSHVTDAPDGTILVCVTADMSHTVDAVRDICTDCGCEVWHDPIVFLNARPVCVDCVAKEMASLPPDDRPTFAVTKQSLERAMKLTPGDIIDGTSKGKASRN